MTSTAVLEAPPTHEAVICENTTRGLRSRRRALERGLRLQLGGRGWNLTLACVFPAEAATPIGFAISPVRQADVMPSVRWQVRDRYVRVVLDRTTRDAFANRQTSVEHDDGWKSGSFWNSAARRSFP